MAKTRFILTFVLVAISFLICQANAGENLLSDVEIRHLVVGTWVIKASTYSIGLPEWERGTVTFADDGSYSAQAIESAGNQRVFHLKWEGRWQIANRILTTPTTNTSGFEDNRHPKALFPPYRIVRISEKQMVYTLALRVPTTNEFILTR